MTKEDVAYTLSLSLNGMLTIKENEILSFAQHGQT